MSEIIFVIIWIGALLLLTILYIKNYNKVKRFEKSLPEGVAKTRGKIKYRFLYKDKNNASTIVRHNLSGKLNELNDFVYERILNVGNFVFLFDLYRKKCAIINDVLKYNAITTRLFEQYKTIELFEEAKTKTVTRGGVSPIAIHGYRVASVTKRREKTITRIYLVITYLADGKEWKQEIDLYNGLLYSTSGAYDRKLQKAEAFMKDFSRYTGCKIL